jgi:hypothetical protein
MSEADPGRWILVGDDAGRGALAPLARHHALSRDVHVSRAAIPSDARGWQRLLGSGAGAVLVVGPYRRSPGRVLPGALVVDRDGRPVPVGWVPAVRELSAFVRTATLVSERRDTSGPVVMLGQRTPRYQHLASRMERYLGSRPRVRWGAERVTREDLLVGLASGLGVAVYLGHGRPSGWAAYRGLRAPDLEPLANRPLGALLSVTCWTASRRGVGVSFAERVVLSGATAASLGAVRPVLHLDSTRVVVSLAEALATSPRDAGTLIARTFADDSGPRPESATYRLCGDPAAMLWSVDGAAAEAYAVFAPPSDYVPGNRQEVPA